MTAKDRFRRIYERFALNYHFSRKNPFGGSLCTLGKVRETYRELGQSGGKSIVSAIAEKMKKESGIGGSLCTVMVGDKSIRFSEQHNAKGITLEVGKCKPQNGGYLCTYEFTYTWSQVAKMALERGIFDEAR